MNLVKSKQMLIRHLIERGVLQSPRMRAVFEQVPRESFVSRRYKNKAYENTPLPLPRGQFISQPLTVAIMTEALDPKEGDTILEIGTGSGYQAALLSVLVGDSGKVITMEIIHDLAQRARSVLSEGGYTNVTVIDDNGHNGYLAEAPYDGIIVTASADDIPSALVDQLRDGGTMVIPVRDTMYVVTKQGTSIGRKSLGNFSFVRLQDPNA